MKNLIIIIAVVVIGTSCKKEEGYMYKACYSYKTSQNETQYSSNFFPREMKDSASAYEWYKQTDAYRHAMVDMKADTLWIEYWGTMEEWIENGKKGMSVR
jgi:hypothetical protein